MIVKRGEYYHYQFQINGKRYRGSTKSTNKAQALRREAARRMECFRNPEGSASLHTPTMTLKNEALLALIGTILATVLLVWTFVSTALNVLRGLAPPVMLFAWFVYAFACFSVAVFFYVFHRAQS